MAKLIMTRQTMTRQIVIALVYLLLLAPTVNAEKKPLSVSDFSEQMYYSWTIGAPLPHISKLIVNANDHQAAVAQLLFVQKRLHSELNEVISGYKAGLTSKAGQKKFNVKAAISGVLFERGQVKSDGAKVNGTVKLSEYRKLMLETEIGFILGSDIDTPVESVEQLKSKISAVMPVIEMPNLAFADLKNITGQDIIASNATANRYLLGEAIPMPVSFSLNDVKTSLQHSTKGKRILVNQGSGEDALGDQWQALLWLVNERLESGYHLSKGQFLITGALGKMLPAQTGHYQADFGPLGKLTFTVTE